MKKLSSSPEVSVIMPSYNAETFISESIDSILQQSFTDFELILIDDGSTDRTLDIIKQYAASDARIVVIEKENSGQTDSMNVGIYKSRGQLIARLDNDDIAMPDRLKKQVAYMRRLPDVVLLGTCAFEIDLYGSTIKKDDYPTNHAHLLNNLKRIKRFFSHSSVMFRSTVVKHIGGYNPRYKIAQDYDLWFRLSEMGQIACLKEHLVKIRNYPNSSSSRDDGLRIMIFESVAANVCYRLRTKGMADPSACENILDWRLFIEWVALRTEQEGFLRRIQLWSRMRNGYFSANNRLSGALFLMHAIAKSKNALEIIYEKFYGPDLPILLTEEWCKRKNSLPLRNNRNNITAGIHVETSHISNSTDIQNLFN